jgi:hypothetical protein
MNYLWDQLLQLACSAGTAEGFNGLVWTGVIALSVVGIIVIAVGIVWQVPHASKEVLAEKRAKRKRQQPAPDDFHPERYFGDLPPTSDI